MTDDTHTIRSGGLTATVKAQGAEMCSLRNDAGVEIRLAGRTGLAAPRAAALSDRRPSRQ
ncbi:hypothetical protein ACVMBY_001701 [Bradyrhizobium huanghuaihaiense]